MRKILKALIPSLVLVVGVALYAAAQSGLLIGLPIVGGASYCSSTVNAVLSYISINYAEKLRIH